MLFERKGALPYGSAPAGGCGHPPLHRLSLYLVGAINRPYGFYMKSPPPKHVGDDALGVPGSVYVFTGRRGADPYRPYR